MSFNGCGKDSPSPPPPPKTTSDQIVIIQPNLSGSSSGGGTGIVSGVSISPVSLPQPLFQSSAVTYNDPSGRSYLYVLGGAYYDLNNSPDPINVNTVYSSLVNPDGTLSAWQVENNSLPINLRGHTSAIYNGAIYVIGGIGVGGFQKTIYKSIITATSTSSSYPILGPWNLVGYLPVEETGHASVISGNMLFVIGGIESGFPPPDCSPNCVGSQTTVYSDKIYGYDLTTSLISPNFSLSSIYTFTMPRKLYTPAAVGLADQLWVLGGWDGVANTNSNTAFLFKALNGTLICDPANCATNTLPNDVGISKAIGLYVSGLDEMFLIGGVSGSLSSPELVRREVFSSFLSSAALGWTQEPSLPVPVTFFSATSAGTTLYVMGGLLNAP